MTITINNTLAQDVLDGIDATFNGGTLTIRTGAAPGAGNAATGTVLATIPLAADAFNPASGPNKSAAGLPWTDTSADATGAAAHFRLVNGASTRVLEGTVTASGGGGDLQLTNVNLQAGNPVEITAFALSLSGA
jgi:hypothetical protein